MDACRRNMPFIKRSVHLPKSFSGRFASTLIKYSDFNSTGCRNTFLKNKRKRQGEDASSEFNSPRNQKVNNFLWLLQLKDEH